MITLSVFQWVLAIVVGLVRGLVLGAILAQMMRQWRVTYKGRRYQRCGVFWVR